MHIQRGHLKRGKWRDLTDAEVAGLAPPSSAALRICESVEHEVDGDLHLLRVLADPSGNELAV